MDSGSNFQAADAESLFRLTQEQHAMHMHSHMVPKSPRHRNVCLCISVTRSYDASELDRGNVPVWKLYATVDVTTGGKHEGREMCEDGMRVEKADEFTVYPNGPDIAATV